MYFELKENKPHGTKDDPFSTYHIKNGGRSFQIPVHWHDELEIIYVKSGFLTVSISGENYIGTPGDAFVVSPGNLHFMGSQTGTVDYFTFLFPVEYISFCINDMLDDKLLKPLKNGHLMIGPRVKDTAKELCEQLVETYMAKNKKIESEITAQIKTKRILLQFILEMWEKGFVIENDKSGRNTVEKETSVYKGYKQDKIEMRGDRSEMSDFPLYLNTVAGGLDCRDQTIGGFSFVAKIYAVPVVEIIG